MYGGKLSTKVWDLILVMINITRLYIKYIVCGLAYNNICKSKNNSMLCRHFKEAQMGSVKVGLASWNFSLCTIDYCNLQTFFLAEL